MLKIALPKATCSALLVTVTGCVITPNNSAKHTFQESKTSTSQPANRQSKTDLEMMQGTWTYQRIDEDGKATFPRPDDGDLTIDGNEMYFLRDGRKMNRITFTVDPNKMPKEIDLSPPNRMAAKGIYSLQVNSMKLCTSDTIDQPKEFKTDRNQTLLILARKIN